MKTFCLGMLAITIAAHAGATTAQASDNPVTDRQLVQKNTGVAARVADPDCFEVPFGATASSCGICFIAHHTR